MITDGYGPIDGFNYNPVAINDSGTVAFLSFLNSGRDGIFTASGGIFTPVIESGSHFNHLGDPAINAGGTVAPVAMEPPPIAPRAALSASSASIPVPIPWPTK